MNILSVVGVCLVLGYAFLTTLLLLLQSHQIKRLEQDRFILDQMLGLLKKDNESLRRLSRSAVPPVQDGLAEHADQALALVEED